MQTVGTPTTPWSRSYRLVDPGSEWRPPRQWFDASAAADLLDADFSLAGRAGHAVPPPGPPRGAQGPAAQVPVAALGNALRREVHTAPVRPDQHRLRDRRGSRRGRSAPVRLRRRQARRLPPIRHGAYCLQIIVEAKLRRPADGSTPHEVPSKFKAMQMPDLHLPTTDRRKLIMSCST